MAFRSTAAPRAAAYAEPAVYLNMSNFVNNMLTRVSNHNMLTRCSTPGCQELAGFVPDRGETGGRLCRRKSDILLCSGRRQSHMAKNNYPQLNRFKTVPALKARLEALGIELPLDERILSAAEGSPLARPIEIFGKTAGNRWCVLPMEGWDGTAEGKPSDHTLHRWRSFGRSGAKLIYGCEAAAVRHDGRANPHQLLICREHEKDFAELLGSLRDIHLQSFGDDRDLLVGLQLTHSGRFSRPDPDGKPKPRILYHHPLLDRRVGIEPSDDTQLLTDEQIEELIFSYIRAAALAAEIGFDFVDIKHCHGYLGHEFLSARNRPGRYGGSLENRTRFLREIVAGIRREAPGLPVAVRISAFDTVPFCADEGGVGRPEDYSRCLPYEFGFGVDRDDPLRIDLSETLELVGMLHRLDIPLVNLSCGSPYYSPHILRPAYFPPSDGYWPPRDPLFEVAQQIHTARTIHRRFPKQLHIGSGYSYLQQFLPLVAQMAIRENWISFVGLGREVLCYPGLPADTLAGGRLQTKKLCRTFSDCTTGPRNGLISGCYRLDPYYKQLPEAEIVKRKRGYGSG
jgi:NADPH2 dehydrogenase